MGCLQSKNQSPPLPAGAGNTGPGVAPYTAAAHEEGARSKSRTWTSTRGRKSVSASKNKNDLMLPEESGTMSEFSNPLAAKRAPQAVESLYEDVAEDAGQQLSYMNVTLNSGAATATSGQITYMPHVPGEGGENGGEPAVAYENADDINDINGAGVSYMNHVPATYSVAKPKKAPQALAAATAPGVGGPAVPDAELSFVPLAVAAEAKATAAAAAADPAQAWAAADFRHPAAIDAARGGMAGGPKHAYMNVQLTANGDEEAAAVPLPKPAARNSVILEGPTPGPGVATAGPASSHSSVQLGAGEELNGDKVFALQEGFVHMKVDDIYMESPEANSTAGYEEVDTSNWGPDTRKNSSASTSSSSPQIVGLDDDELILTSYDNVEYGQDGPPIPENSSPDAVGSAGGQVQVAYKTWSLDEQRETARQGQPKATQSSPNPAPDYRANSDGGVPPGDAMYEEINTPGGDPVSEFLYEQVTPQVDRQGPPHTSRQYDAVFDGVSRQEPAMTANDAYSAPGQLPQLVYSANERGVGAAPGMYGSLNMATATHQAAKPRHTRYNHLEIGTEGNLVARPNAAVAAANTATGVQVPKGSRTASNAPTLRAGAPPKHPAGAASASPARATRNPYNQGTGAPDTGSSGQAQAAAQGHPQTAAPPGGGVQVAGAAKLVTKRYQNEVITGPAPSLRAQQAPATARAAKPGGGRLRGAGVGGSGAAPSAKSGLAADPRNSRMAAASGTRC